MEGGMAITPICNPHICRVLLDTAGYFGVLSARHRFPQYVSFVLFYSSHPCRSLVNLQTKGLWKTMPGLINQVPQVFPESDWTVTEHSTFEPTRSQPWLLRNDGWLFVCLFSVIFSLILFWFKFRCKIIRNNILEVILLRFLTDRPRSSSKGLH